MTAPTSYCDAPVRQMVNVRPADAGGGDDVVLRRAKRWARRAAAWDGCTTDELMGEAWILAHRPAAIGDAVARLLDRTGPERGVSEDPLPWDAEAIEGGWKLAHDVMAGAYGRNARDIFGQALLRLTPREHGLLARMVGINTPEQTGVDMALEIGVNPTRIHALQRNALRKLRNTSLWTQIRSLLHQGMPNHVDRHVGEASEPDADTPWTVWDVMVRRAGGNTACDFWPWHVCPIVEALVDQGIIASPHEMRHPPRNANQGWRMPARFETPDATVKVDTRPGLAYASSIEFKTSRRQMKFRHAVRNNRVVTTGSIWMGDLPATLRMGMRTAIGRPLGDVAEHPLLRRGFFVVDVAQDGDLVVESTTRQLRLGGTNYRHPMGLITF